MKLLTFEKEGKLSIGVLWHNNVIDMHSLGFTFSDMNDLIEHCSDTDLKCMRDQCEKGQGTIVTNFKWKAPIMYPKQDIICLGVNYLDHAKESAKYKKETFEARNEAVYFAKRVNQAIGHLESINSHCEVVKDLDYENELAVVIRKDCAKVNKEEVYDQLFGYTILNDITARTIQHKHKQWYFGKSLDTFCSMGPVIITKDEIAYPCKLDIKTHVNGEMRQNANTSDLIFDIDYVIQELSSLMTLKSGTIIATGTPSGVAMGMSEPQFLKPNDTVTCSIEQIGELTNIIK